MRKIFTILAIIAAPLCLSSCVEDKDMNYEFVYDALGSIQDDDTRTLAEEYFKEHFSEKTVSYYGKRYDVMEKALAQFGKDIEAADDETIYSFIEYEEDIIQLIGYLSNGKNTEWVGTRTWDYSGKLEWENGGGD